MGSFLIIGFVPLTQDPTNVTIIMPTQSIPSSPSSPIDASSLLFVVQGYSWSNNEANFGLYPSPNPFSNTDVSGNIAKFNEFTKRTGVDLDGLYHIGGLLGPLSYRGLGGGKATVVQFISDGILGMKIENIFCHFGPEPSAQYGPFGIGIHKGLVPYPTCATSNKSNPMPPETSNYTISYTIQDMGTIPKGTPTGWIPPPFSPPYTTPIPTGSLHVFHFKAKPTPKIFTNSTKREDTFYCSFACPD